MALNYEEVKRVCKNGTPVCVGRLEGSTDFNQIPEKYCISVEENRPGSIANPNCSGRITISPVAASSIRREGKRLKLKTKNINQAIRLYPYRYQLARAVEKMGVPINDPNDIFEVVTKLFLARQQNNFENIYEEKLYDLLTPELGGWYRYEKEGGTFKENIDFDWSSLPELIGGAINDITQMIGSFNVPSLTPSGQNTNSGSNSQGQLPTSGSTVNRPQGQAGEVGTGFKLDTTTLLLILGGIALILFIKK